jgi:hypothetical protein
VETLGLTLNAAFVQMLAVVHLASLRTEPSGFLQKRRLLNFRLASKDFYRLVEYIDAGFERSGGNRAMTTGPGSNLSDAPVEPRVAFTCSTLGRLAP